MSSEKLKELLDKNKDKRVIIIGTTCSGKTTMMQGIKDAEDMDELIFPLLSKEESDYVCSPVWTEEIGKTMTRLVKERVKVKKGKPLFGTVVLDCDLIIFLDIDDELLKERCKKRKANFANAENMQKQIIHEVKKSKIPSINIKVQDRICAA